MEHHGTTIECFVLILILNVIIIWYPNRPPRYRPQMAT